MAQLEVLTAQLIATAFSHCVFDKFHLCFMRPCYQAMSGPKLCSNPGIMTFRTWWAIVTHHSCHPSALGSWL